MSIKKISVLTVSVLGLLGGFENSFAKTKPVFSVGVGATVKKVKGKIGISKDCVFATLTQKFRYDNDPEHLKTLMDMSDAEIDACMGAGAPETLKTAGSGTDTVAIASNLVKLIANRYPVVADHTTAKRDAFLKDFGQIGFASNKLVIGGRVILSCGADFDEKVALKLNFIAEMAFKGKSRTCDLSMSDSSTTKDNNEAGSTDKNSSNNLKFVITEKDKFSFGVGFSGEYYFTPCFGLGAGCSVSYEQIEFDAADFYTNFLGTTGTPVYKTECHIQKENTKDEGTLKNLRTAPANKFTAKRWKPSFDIYGVVKLNKHVAITAGLLVDLPGKLTAKKGSKDTEANTDFVMDRQLGLGGHVGVVISL